MMDADRQVQQFPMFQMQVDRRASSGRKPGRRLTALVARADGQAVIQFDNLTEGLIDSDRWLGH